MKGRLRYIVYASLFVMMMINYIDSINLSMAAGDIQSAYKLSPIELGYFFSAYSWTYALCLVPRTIATAGRTPTNGCYRGA
jgi:ACS family glucarate transporter-like MFS transporter